MPLDLLSDGIDILELSRELWKALKELFYYNYAETLALALTSEGLDNELQCNILQDTIKQLVLNDGSK